MRKIDLLQPRHNYAPSPEKETQGHIYMPTSLMTAGARLQHANIDVRLHDANLRLFEPTTHEIGINLLGAPYIPEVIQLQKKIHQQFGEKFDFVLGGQVVNGLTGNQFSYLFGEDAVNGNRDDQLVKHFGLHPLALPPVELTSLVPMYELLSDEDMREYLSREFSFFLSQGCKFSCDFCAAVRTIRDPATGELNKAKESYRFPGVLKKDLEYLVKRAKDLGLDHLEIYLSNLDVFQTPVKLYEFAQIVNEIRESHEGFQISMRGLATVDSFLKARKKFPQSIEEMVRAGFHAVGFGVDGMGIWKKIKKGHNTKKKCLEAIRSACEDYQITPELLMVFGHAGVDTSETLRMAYEFTEDMVDKYRAVPRPHVAKSFIPGNKGWNLRKNARAIAQLIGHPETFQMLDFTALPTRFTHPDENIRELATHYFLKICSISGNATQFVKPLLPEFTMEEVQQVKSFNEGKYDR